MRIVRPTVARRYVLAATGALTRPRAVRSRGRILMDTAGLTTVDETTRT